MGSTAAVREPVALETARLLWEVARPEPDVAAIREIAAAGADIDAVAGASIGNNVGALCYRALVRAGLIDKVGPIGDVLRQGADLRRLQAQLLLPVAMARIVEPMRAAGFEPLVFKGPTLAARFPEPGLRPMDDIDVILPEHQHQEALATLVRAGWRAIEQRPGDHYDTFLVHPDVPDLPLELHWDVAVWHERATSVRAQDLWRRRQPRTVFGTEAYVLPPEEELVALANHAGKPFHHFSRLLWSVDIALVIDTTPGGLDWDRVASIARRWRCRTVLAVALHHARRLRAEVPDSLLRLPDGRSRRAAIRPVLAPDWPFVIPDDHTTYRLRYALSDSKVRQMQLVLGELTSGASSREVPGRAWQLARRLAGRWREDRRARQDDPGMR